MSFGEGARKTEMDADAPSRHGSGPLSAEVLRDWDFAGQAIGVLGHPIAHSLSPVMHNAALAAMARTDPRFARWRYFAFDIAPEMLRTVLPEFAHCGFRGLNLTIPHKVDVLPLLEAVEPAAARMGAVNTLILHESGGSYLGANTDGYGISRAVAAEFGRSLKGAKIVLLGAGGAARAIAVQCMEEGCSELWIGNRNQERLAGLIELVGGLFPESRKRIRAFSLDASLQMERGALVINATALGLKPNDPAPLDLAGFGEETVVYDTTYGAVNGLARDASALGFTYADGLSMLVWQGARSLGYWTGCEPPVDVMAQAARTALNNRFQP